MGYNRKQYHWTGEDTKSAEDRALDTFAELMMERIKAIDKDWQKPWIEKGSFMMPRNLSGRPYNGINLSCCYCIVPSRSSICRCS